MISGLDCSALTLAVVSAMALPSFAADASTPEAHTIEVPAEPAKDDAQQALLDKGTALIKDGKPAQAIMYFLDKVISHYETLFKDSEQKVYCSRSMVESLLYLGTAAASDPHQNAIVISPTWADTYNMKGYALLDLGQISEARASIEKAVALSPFNAQYLAELAYTYKADKNWAESLKKYKEAEEAADSFSPDELKPSELGRALRGQGYALVELGRLDEAAAVYEKSMAVDPNDKIAGGELEYIRALRKQNDGEVK